MKALTLLTILTGVTCETPGIICGVVDNGTHFFGDYETDVLSCEECEETLCRQSDVLDYKKDNVCYWNEYKGVCLSGRGEW